MKNSDEMSGFSPKAKAMQGTKDFDYAAYLAELRLLPEIDYDRPL